MFNAGILITCVAYAHPAHTNNTPIAQPAFHETCKISGKLDTYSVSSNKIICSAEAEHTHSKSEYACAGVVSKERKSR
jgi:hypothetical protein